GVLAEEKRQTINVDAPLPALVNADRMVLRQAIVNLVDNAVKYSPAGAAIRLTIATEPDAIHVEGTDPGPGIAPEHLEKIFDRFYGVEESRAPGGAGSGLWMARWAVEANNGHIAVSSEPGHGSTFRVILPRTTAGLTPMAVS